MYNSTRRQICRFNSHFNNIHHSLTFTSEIEKINSLNYLALTITKEVGKHNFKVYIKPPQTDHTIHTTSNQPQSQTRSFMHRVLTVPMKPANVKT